MISTEWLCTLAQQTSKHFYKLEENKSYGFLEFPKGNLSNRNNLGLTGRLIVETLAHVLTKLFQGQPQSPWRQPALLYHLLP